MELNSFEIAKYDIKIITYLVVSTVKEETFIKNHLKLIYFLNLKVFINFNLIIYC